jgi:hypothetical protein
MQNYRVVIEWTGQIRLPDEAVDANGDHLRIGDVVSSVTHPEDHYRITNDWWHLGVFKGVWIETPGIFNNSTVRTRTATKNLIKVKP